MKVGEAACHFGMGIVAGLVGTAAITASQLIEMRIRGRSASKTAAKAAEKVLGIEPISDQAETRLATLIHWGYGTGWGIFRGILGMTGVHGPIATVLQASSMEVTAMVMLPGLKVTPPVQEWGIQETAIEMLHHLVYASAAGMTYDKLCQSAFQKPTRGMTWNWLVGGLTAVGLRQVARSLGLVRQPPSRIERSRRLVTVAWQRDWPQARRELTALWR